jgi:YVTN family beta-propeller protein
MSGRFDKLALVFAAAAGMLAAGGGYGDLNFPTGTRGLLLIDKLGAQIRFFDPVSFVEISSVAVAKNPHDFVLNADHSQAYVPIYGDGVYGRNPNPAHEVLIVDMAARGVSGSIDVSPYRAPHGIQIDSNGMLYVACDLDRKVLVLDPKTRSIKDAIDTEGTGHWIAILPDGSKLYVANKEDRLFVSVIDLKTRKMVGRIPMPTGTQGITASPDGKMVVAMDSGQPTITVIDPATDTVKERIPIKGQSKGGGYKAYFSPDGKKLVTMSLGERTGNVFDAANLKGEQKTFQTGKDPMGFAFSADGKTLLVANHGDGTVSVVDLQKVEPVKSFHAGTGIETLTYY